MPKQCTLTNKPSGPVFFAPLQRCFRCCGLTLLELLTTLAIISVMAAVAVPSLSNLVRSIRTASISSTFLSQLRLARSEAIKRNDRVVVCKSATATSCATSGGWNQGWIVFHDANNNAQLDTGETVIHHEGPISASMRFSGNQNVAQYVSYTPTGVAKLVNGAFQAGTFHLCQSSVQNGEVTQIVLGSSGNPRLHKVQNTPCS